MPELDFCSAIAESHDFRRNRSTCSGLNIPTGAHGFKPNK